jgi:hypothetical protein
MKRTLYVLWKESVNSDGEPCHLYKQNNVLARPEPVPGFPTLCVVFLMLVTDFEVRGDFVDIDWILDHHGLKILSVPDVL